VEKIEKITTPDVERCILRRFGVRQNIIIFNISWGFLNYEADVLICGRYTRLLDEIEIKVSKQDFRADSKKRRHHSSKRTRYFSYAVPWYICDYVKENIEDGVGLYSVDKKGWLDDIVAPKKRCDYRLTENEQLKLAILGCMRIQNIYNSNCKKRELFNTDENSDQISLFGDDWPGMVRMKFKAIQFADVNVLSVTVGFVVFTAYDVKPFVPDLFIW
jgi:hypothetical protein